MGGRAPLMHEPLPPGLAVGLERVVGLLRPAPRLAIDETVILLHPPLPLVGVPIVMERGCQQNDSLVNG